MSNEAILIALSALVVAGIVYELRRSMAAGMREERRKASTAFDIWNAQQLGQWQAKQGFDKEDYPTGYSPAEIEAWQRGWDEYHERS